MLWNNCFLHEEDANIIYDSEISSFSDDELYKSDANSIDKFYDNVK